MKRNAQAAIEQDYSISTATVQPRCGDERDSFQLRVEAVCRPGTLEQWWRWLWTRTRRWRGDWRKDSTIIDAPSTTAVQQGRRYGGGGRREKGGQWGGRRIGCVGVVMHFPIHSGENLSIVTTPALQLVISDNTCWDIQEKCIQLWVV